MGELTHFNDEGRARMVDVSKKDETFRVATARCTVKMLPETLQAIIEGRVKKGDVLAVSQVAGIMAAKQTWALIPMCHPLFLNGADIHFRIDEKNSQLDIEGVVRTSGKTGVEMEALSAVSVAALTVYDMCKAMDKGMIITDIRLIEKSGGKSGLFKREGEEQWKEK